MARINTKNTNTHRDLTATTHEGAPVKPAKGLALLRRSVLGCLLFEDNFYEDGQSAAARIVAAAKNVSMKELCDLAIEARRVHGLRGAPLMLLAAGFEHPNYSKPEAKKLLEDAIAQVCDRADLPGELVALYWKDGKRSLAGALRRGLAKALLRFNEYALAKYAKRGGIRLRDVMFLTHPKPEGKEQTELFKKLANDELDAPDTWEVRLSSGEDKREVFTDLLKRNKLGALALLRNLRNMVQAGVDYDLIRDALRKLDPEKARIFPYQFIAAARHAPTMEDVLEEPMLRCAQQFDKLPGHTVLVIDRSGSMQDPLSSKSELRRHDAAAGLAVLARECCERVTILEYNVGVNTVPPRRGFGLLAALQPPSGMTNTGLAVQEANRLKPDRIIVFTDEQAHTRIPQPYGKGYIMNVANYQHGIGWGAWVTISGFSEHLLRFVLAAESTNTER